ncbi:uncharacterized protein LOC129596414 [Paramacrobiotus metropolitanus]|uniref:uncharacterized protein LOC129596414 n=1 Tax=Paramacrobiotus metropolitanus TaxID=2943436 RepID=UPI002445FE18|nr:uncharacterized protein LOC129596414 [Paramacrobiotus metropolitanus]
MALLRLPFRKMIFKGCLALLCLGMSCLGVVQAFPGWLEPYFPPVPYLPFPSPPCGGGCPPPPPNPCPNPGCQCQNSKHCSILLNQIPWTVEVPCFAQGQGSSPATIVSVFNDTCGPQTYDYQQHLVSSSDDDIITPYAYVTGNTGNEQIFYNPSALSSTLVQTIAFTAVGTQNRVASQTIFITFRFAACMGSTTTSSPGQTALILQCPTSASVCPGYPPGTDPSGRTYNSYPQLTCSVSNAPPLFPLVFDLASNAAPVSGFGAPNGLGPGENWNINSPAVLPGSDEPNVFISSMNPIAGLASTSTVGIYGASNNGALPCPGVTPITTSTDPVTGMVTGNCCQTLRFSVSPGVMITPYTAGYQDVKVCYQDWATCTIV